VNVIESEIGCIRQDVEITNTLATAVGTLLWSVQNSRNLTQWGGAHRPATDETNN